MTRLLFWLIAAVPYAAFAQITPYKNVDVTAENTIMSYKLFAQKPLTKENTFTEIYPEKLNNNTPAAVRDLIDPYLSMDAKRVKAGQPAQYTFKYITEGITNLLDDGNSRATESPYVTTQGYYKRLAYNCPLKVEIYNEEKQLIKTLVIANTDKLFYVQIDKNLLAPPPGFGQENPVITFTSEEDANNFYTANKKKIAEKLEAACLNRMKDDIKTALYSVYDFAKFRKDYIWYFAIDKKSQASFPDMFEKTSLLQTLIKDFDEPAKKQAAVKELAAQYDFYTQQLKDAKAIPEDVRQMCRYNAALTALFTNKMAASQQLYGEFYNKFYLRSPFGIIGLPEAFKKLYSCFYTYYAVQDGLSQPVTDVTNSIEVVHYNRFLTDNKLTDPRMLAAKRAANPENTGYDEKRNKDVLRATWLSYLCWNTSSNTVHIEPGEYIYKEGTGEITGQKFLSGSGPRKNIIISLETTTGNMKKGGLSNEFNGSNVEYTWEFNKLTGIKIDGLSEYDYTFIYDEDNNMITGVKAKRLINDEFQTIAKVQWSDDKIIKITRWENSMKWKDEWIRAIKNITYTDTGIVVFCRTYHTGKTNTEKNSSVLTGIYRKSDGKKYVVVQPYGVTTENTYNDNDDILKSVENKINGIDETSFFYNGRKVFKTVTLEKDLAGTLKQKVVYIAEVQENLPANAPEYEKRKGQYRFSPAGEMIWESNGTQYRIKTNGVWGDWQYFKY